jgi:predicted RNA binding protein with dsRBD fold (UPF0201 family)
VLVEVVAEVRDTEDEGKVMLAIRNLVDLRELDLVEREGRRYVVGSCSGYGCLMKLRGLIRRQGIEGTVRMILMGSAADSQLEFRVNKQTAYVGVLSFVTEGSESPLGPIVFRIRSSDIRSIIDWLSLRTPRVHEPHGSSSLDP